MAGGANNPKQGALQINPERRVEAGLGGALFRPSLLRLLAYGAKRRP